ncbi:hypothetical protein [Clostridium psychrophilum]|uniref:hypothetical protein n=1 Tax=Clostridium psychrophilum TaxID=132926 RepID=UPI001C0C4B0B|nr:hypothetical protein [Clostridium psychrophilum]MBU3182598.1 hypothetical protein [Clostridium psychrophilum]
MEIEKHIVTGKPYTKVLPIKTNYGIDDDQSPVANEIISTINILINKLVNIFWLKC